MNAVWEKRFGAQPHPKMLKFTRSISSDLRLWKYDIAGSKIHVKVLKKAGLLSESECTRLMDGLDQIYKEFSQGKFKFKPADEDIHMAVERRLEEKIGKPAGKLHTGRSRNDQVSCDLRLFCADYVAATIASVKKTEQALSVLSRKYGNYKVPGFTHMQHAQVITLRTYFGAYVAMLERDSSRLKDALKRIKIMPLGAAALAGTPFNLDRKYAAKLAGFPGVAANTVDAVSDRDFVLELLSVLSILAGHLSRLAEDLIVWSSPEFGFVELADEWCTGSSIMPQKKNPDVLELIRGRSARVASAFQGLSMVLKGLPLSYNRDLQEDKIHLWNAVDAVDESLDVVPDVLKTIKFDRKRLTDACKIGFMEATDWANYLVTKGIPFREAHNIVGRMIKYCLKTGRKSLSELSLSDVRRFSTRFGSDFVKKNQK